MDAGRLMNYAAQQRWSATPLRTRLKILKKARHRMAAMQDHFTEAISPTLARTPADTLITELLPLLDACRFLEDNAADILQPRLLGSNGRPQWLRGLEAEVRRDPLGHILVIAPSNFPLFLPGVQILQALAAGNSVTWKPGTGGGPVAELVASALTQSGLPEGLLTITDDTIDAAYIALAEQPDKVIFTGSVEAGKDILYKLAETATPAIMELSGVDAVIVLPTADLARAARAIAFGLRLNGAAVCMSPRRLLALGDTMTAILPHLERELATIPAVSLPPRTAAQLQPLLAQAVDRGATLRGTFEPTQQKPLLIASALPTMDITNADIFAPVLSLITVSTVPKFSDVYAECPYSLTVSIFGDEREALALAAKLRAGAVLINDLIVPTADPHLPFGGRGASGYGVTRGAEGLLEMTTAKTVITRRNRSTRHYLPTSAKHIPLFSGMITALHGRTLMQRLKGFKRMVAAGRNFNKGNH
jgi:acyl-CoA reductase-like NAD-dependent aldehyde dehydrogenase